jgi:flagellar basal body-associated protein FliL
MKQQSNKTLIIVGLVALLLVVAVAVVYMIGKPKPHPSTNLPMGESTTPAPESPVPAATSQPTKNGVMGQ